MKKNLIAIYLFVLFFIILGSFLIYSRYPKYDTNKAYVSEYIVGDKGVKGNVDITYFGNNPAYKIGANREGYAVFKNPEQAFSQMKVDYAKGITAIQKEYRLMLLSRWNFKEYESYGWQFMKTDDADAVKQAKDITKFMDIYDNSFYS